MLEQEMADFPQTAQRSDPPSPTSTSMRLHRGRYREGGIEEERQTANAVASSAIRMELFETMDASSFICALRRFVSILRGPATRLRGDRCSNFVSENLELDEALAEMDKISFTEEVLFRGFEWQFSLPHASHFGKYL